MTQLTLAKRFENKFFARPPVDVAPGLLGAVLWRKLDDDKIVGGRIVETEAYWGEQDLACHARYGKTKRSLPLWGPPGTAYIYLIYGMYHCLNVVTEPEGIPSAVLIRALEPLPLHHQPPLCEQSKKCLSGPGKLCRALGITRTQNQIDLLSGNELWLEPGRPPATVATSPRVGVDYAPDEWALKPWRFYDADSPFVSGKK